MTLVMVALLIVVAIQAAAIFALLISRSRRVRGEGALRESEERFRLMAEHAPVMMWTARPDTTLDYLNGTCMAFTGLPLEQLLDEGWLSCVHPDDLDHCTRTYVPAVAARRPFLMEYRLRGADGVHRWVLASGVPKFKLDGSFAGYIGCSTDIDEKKRAESELLQHRGDLAHLTRVATLNELAASFAHELTQPLTAILSNAQAAQTFLARPPIDPMELHEVLRDIIEDDHRANAIIQRLRALARKEQLEFTTLDLEAALREVTLLLRGDAIANNVRIRLELERGLPPVRGDRVQLQQVALNLLLNAFHAMRELPTNERQVVVQAGTSTASAVTVAVRDRGPGLADAELDRIFHSFYTTKSDGLGMGLSISRSIVQAHGGRLWAENNAARGATFYFTVPVENDAHSSSIAHDN